MAGLQGILTKVASEIAKHDFIGWFFWISYPLFILPVWHPLSLLQFKDTKSYLECEIVSKKRDFVRER